MTNSTELARQYRVLADALGTVGEYTIHAFDVDYWDETIPVVHVEESGWSWGSCVNERCGHVSHDPLTIGPTVHVLARLIGQAPDDPDRTLYALPDGRVVAYRHRSRGQHYNPRRSLHLHVVAPAIAQSNARLIAAAPALLEACHLALEWFERETGPGLRRSSDEQWLVDVLRGAVTAAEMRE